MKERFIFHWRFYLPASLILLLVFPGVISGEIYHRPLAYAVSLTVTFGFVFAFLCIFLLPLSHWPKVALAGVLSCVTFWAKFGWMRDEAVGTDFLDFPSEATFFHAYIPLFVISALLCFWEKDKRNQSRIFLVWALVPVFAGLNFSVRDTYANQDWLILRDVAMRMSHGPENGGVNLNSECMGLSTFKLRQECLARVTVAVTSTDCGSNRSIPWEICRESGMKRIQNTVEAKKVTPSAAENKIREISEVMRSAIK